MAVDGTHGYEQARSDLLVAKALGDQPRDFCFSLPEQSRRGTVRRRRGNMTRLTKRQSDCGASAQALSGLELGLESRCPKRRDRRLFGLGEQRGGVACAMPTACRRSDRDADDAPQKSSLNLGIKSCRQAVSGSVNAGQLGRLAISVRARPGGQDHQVSARIQ